MKHTKVQNMFHSKKGWISHTASQWKAIEPSELWTRLLILSLLPSSVQNLNVVVKILKPCSPGDENMHTFLESLLVVKGNYHISHFSYFSGFVFDIYFSPIPFMLSVPSPLNHILPCPTNPFRPQVGFLFNLFTQSWQALNDHLPFLDTKL